MKNGQGKYYNNILYGCFLVLILIACSVYGQNGYYISLQQALKQPDSVVSLSLKHQKLKAFPSEILEFKNLQRLDLSRNYIRTIPQEISSLKHLHYVNFAQNNIDSLPLTMSSLPIDTLILWDTYIREFDTSFSSLPLKFLDLRAITMTRKEQKAIINIFPNAKIRKDHPCNCGR